MAAEPTPVSIHRCRFIDYDPSPITALAFPPLPLPSNKRNPSFSFPGFGILVIGHANGNIDLAEWSGEPGSVKSPQAWTIRKKMVGPYPSKVDALALTISDVSHVSPDQVPSNSQLRLFSTGGSNELCEWDMQRGCIRRTLNSQGGSIWSIASNPAGTRIALGCEDGAVRLVNLEGDGLILHRRFDKVKARLLSIAWGPPIPPQAPQKSANATSSDSSDSDSDDEWADSWIVAGGSDSCLRKWDVSSGKVLEKMGMDKQRGERTLVWTVAVLGNGTIISGDSLGMVKFWDSKTCTQIQSFQGHGADVLCIAVGPKNTVYTSGVDQKISEFAFIKQKQSDSTLKRFSSRWVHSCSRRMHSHDVRALAVWPPHSALPTSHQRTFPPDISPVLASGGLDMSVTLTPASPASNTVFKITNPLCTSQECTFEGSYHRRIAYASTSASAVSISRRARLIVCMGDAGLSLWKVHESPKSRLDNEGDDPMDSSSNDWEKVLDMDLSLDTNLRECSLSEDGKWLIASDLYETKLFQITQSEDGTYKPRRIRDFSAILRSSLAETSLQSGTGGGTFVFSPDCSKLVMSTVLSAHVFVIDLGNGEDQPPRVLRRFDQHIAPPVARVIRGREKANGASNMADEVSDKPQTSSDEDEEDNVISKPIRATILGAAISADGQWLATADDQRRTHVFNLDSLMHNCVLPSFSLPPSVLTFDPSSPGLLVLAFPNNTLQFFNVETRRFPSWSKDLSNSLLQRLTTLHETILGITFSPTAGGNYALIWGSTWLCKVFISESAGIDEVRRNKRRQSSEMSPIPDKQADREQELKILTHYRPVLAVDFIGDSELVVVERPLVDVLASLPPAYFKHKYGRS
jgi:U3 small nucleolar RNA-associated protein 4